MARGYDDRSSESRNRYKGASTLKLEDLADYLQSECDVLTADMEALLKASADDLKEKIMADSPKDTGAYALGWVVTKRQKPGDVEFVVRNKTKYQLTHLLEHGHDNPLTGDRTPGIPHINDNADHSIRECGDNIDKMMKKVT